MRRACIDIGSNTTRLLVADVVDGRLRELHQERVFTRIGTDLRADGRITAAKIAEVSAVVGGQLERARALAASPVYAVATAAIRQAGNGAELVAAVERDCGLQVRVLSGGEEARLAFLGASSMLQPAPAGLLGVVDVGGGSCELAVGEVGSSPAWSDSLPLGSGDLADRYLHSDPPTPAELTQVRRQVERVLAGLRVPSIVVAVAVGGSATSLWRLAGPRVDLHSSRRALSLLCAEPAMTMCRRFGLDLERVRLLPAGLLILEAVGERFGLPLEIGRGGVREGVLLEGGSKESASA